MHMTLEQAAHELLRLAERHRIDMLLTLPERKTWYQIQKALGVDVHHICPGDEKYVQAIIGGTQP